MKNNEEKSSKTGITVLAIIVVLSVSLNFIQFYNKKPVFTKKRDLVEQNERLQGAISGARSELNKYKGINDKLDKIIQNANNRITEQEAKINRLFRDKKTLAAENEKLEQDIVLIKEQYLEQIDSLLVVNKLNEALNETIEELNEKIAELSVKVGAAEMLIGDNMKITPQKETLIGNKAAPTAMAKKTKSVKICFDILENRITKRGATDIYMRILTPDAQVLTNKNAGSGTFTHPMLETNAIYSEKQTVNYTNEKLNLCFDWDILSELKTGIYLVEIYSPKNRLITSTFTLK
ncbi:MAG: hypothetical protein JXJ22_08245 [Bacteroidales bacterium]|nr:hypothetical protein [Bacteroidales bacterium]